MKELLITNDFKNIQNGFNKIILWNDFYSSTKKKVFSISTILEKDKINFKKKFLRLAYLYRKKTWKNSLLNNLIDDDFETFFLSSLFNQSAYVDNCLHFILIKFLVLADFLKKEKIKKLTINIKDRDISHLIEKYCEYKKITYNNISKKDFFFNFDKKKFLKKIEYFYKIVQIIRKIKFKSQKEFHSQKGEILILDIFTHFNNSEAINGKFVSSYWGSLYNKIFQNNINAKWVHIFYAQKNIKNLKSANKCVDKFNIKLNNNAHFILENFFSYKDLFKAFKIYAKFFLSFLFNYQSIKIKHKSPFYGFNKIFHPYLIDTFIGYTAIRNIIFYLSIKNLIGEIKEPSLGLYIMENQTFEIILNHLWKKKFSSEILGFPHSCVRFWDLKYFFIKPEVNKFYFPNKVCIHSKDTYEWAKYLKLSNQQILDVESIRHENVQNSKKVQVNAPPKNIIIYGDLDDTSSYNLCNIIQNISNINFFFKNHPASSFNKENIKFKNITFIDHDLDFDEIDCVITANGSTTAFKPYYSKFPFLIYLSPDFFNLSPINNLSNDVFFHDIASFEVCLNKIREIRLKNEKLHLIDKNCIRWIDVLKLNKAKHRFNFEKLGNIL